MEMTRRNFMGAAAGMAVATMGAAVVFDAEGNVKPAQALIPNTDVPEKCGVDGITQLDQINAIQPDWVDPNTYDGLLAEVRNMTWTDEDLVFEDGTVIPAVYVNLRNLINRMGKGFGGTPDSTSYQLIMHLWTEEEAAWELEMPMLSVFNAYDYSMKSGRSVEECAQILDAMAKKCLIYHMVRGGADYYMLLPHINGWWEFTELKAHYDALNAGEDTVAAVAEYNQYNTWSAEGAGIDDFDNTFPLFRTYPVDIDCIAEDEFAPYMDWRAIIARHKMITVSPCQCRIMWDAIGVPTPEGLPKRTCLSLGEVAEFFLECGIGEQITQEEAVAIYEDAIEKGMVVESIATKDADIMCLCHGSACGNLMGFKGMAGSGNALNAWKNWNAYWLDYDAEKCIKCGLCANRCPMEAIAMDGEDGACTHNLACVRCGQCIKVCPAEARILRLRDGFPELPEDYLDSHRTIAKERMFRGAIVDFVG